MWNTIWPTYDRGESKSKFSDTHLFLIIVAFFVIMLLIPQEVAIGILTWLIIISSSIAGILISWLIIRWGIIERIIIYRERKQEKN